MRANAALDLIACAGHLAVANMVLLRPVRSPLVLPLGLLALDLFAWNFANFAYKVSGRVEWHVLDLSLSPFSPALALHLCAAFVGLTRALRTRLVLSYSFFVGIAASAWLAFPLPSVRAWLDSTAYSALFLSGQLAVIAQALVLLFQHLRQSHDAEERVRTKTMIGAVLTGAVLTTTDFWNDFGIAVPSMAGLGTLVSVAMMAWASLRFHLLGKNLSLRLTLAAVALSTLGILGYVAAFRWLGSETSVLMVATATITLMLLVALRQVASRYAAHRDRMEGLANMGRFSAQMAHDLKNPLAALKGALQFLGEELARGQTLAKQEQFLGLVERQVDRIHRVVDDYHRLGQMEPRLSEVDLNRTVEDVLALQAFAAQGIVVEMQLARPLPCWQLDPNLVARAVENLVRNAAEAMPDGGVLSVRTSPIGPEEKPSQISVAVTDTGIGMDARQVERAFDDFFTTKPHGSGLGLAFVKRVVETHGGEVKVVSELGRGTTVTMQFPAR